MENSCVVEIHKTVKKHPVSLVVAFISESEKKDAMKAYEKAQVPVPAYELHAEGPDDPCLEEVPDFDGKPVFYIYRDGVKVGKVVVDRTNLEDTAKQLKKSVEEGSNYKYEEVKQ